MDSLPNIKFGKPAHGWMTVTVGEFQSDVSDVPCDSLYGLCKALTFLLNGFPPEPVEWSKEPGYEKWVFNREGQNCRFSIIDINGLTVNSLVLPTRPLIRQFVNQLEQLATDFELEAENPEFWSWGFPNDQIKAIKSKMT